MQHSKKVCPTGDKRQEGQLCGRKRAKRCLPVMKLETS